MFRKLDPLKTGSLDMKMLHRYFRGGQSSEEDWTNMYECLQPIGRTSHLTYAVSGRVCGRVLFTL